MFRKYEKTFRILVPQINIKGKHFLSGDETQRLLGGNVVITEKMDGANVGIIRNKNDFRLQKRGSLVDASEHYQFNFFKAWSQANYDKLMQIPIGTILYGELMICQHTVHYDMLPDYFLAFGWANSKTNEYYHRDEMTELCDKLELSYTQEIARGGGFTRDGLFDLIPNPSSCGHEPAEGLIVWNYKANMRGKVVKEEFQKSIDTEGHWARKKIVKNIVSNICTCEQHEENNSDE